jgi:hypothetical protein
MENQRVGGERTKQTEEPKTTERRDLADKIGAGSWGSFFVWVGIALLTDVGFGVGLLGVGMITLGGQATRHYFNLKLEVFWLVVGLCFVLGGLWELFQPALPLGPILLIIAGLAVIPRSFWPRGQRGSSQ